MSLESSVQEKKLKKKCTVMSAVVVSQLLFLRVEGPAGDQ